MDALRNAGLVPSARFDFKDVPDQTGKVAIVTGGSAGIGRSVVKALSDKGARVIILSNKEEHASDTMDELKSDKIEWKQVDLSDLQQTRKVAEELAKDEPQINILLANAGLGVGKAFATPAGLDAHLTINHISQMLLVNRLLPNIRKTVSTQTPPPSARIVFQSSELHRGAHLSTKFEADEFKDTSLGPLRTYSRTKLAQILFCKALVERANLGDKQIKSLAVHPGGVLTDQHQQAEEAYGVLGKVGEAVAQPLMRSPDHGALAMVWAAVSPKIDETDSQGRYYDDPDSDGKETKQAGDDELIENLWKNSEAIIREQAGQDALISWTQGA